MTRLLPVLALGPLADMRQVLQPDETVRVGVHNAPTDKVVALLASTVSLALLARPTVVSPRECLSLQALPQSDKVVGLSARLSAGKERCHISCVCGNSQVSLTQIHTHHTLMRRGMWVCDFNLKAH